MMPKRQQRIAFWIVAGDATLRNVIGDDPKTFHAPFDAIVDGGRQADHLALGKTKPIGKKGRRKVNPSYKHRSRQPWSTTDVNKLNQLAKGNTSTGVMNFNGRLRRYAARPSVRGYL
jgi:hypothetical protein